MEDTVPVNNRSNQAQPSTVEEVRARRSAFSWTKAMLVIAGILLMVFIPFGFILAMTLFIFTFRSRGENATDQHHKPAYLFEIGAIVLAIFLFAAANFVSNTVNALGGW